MTKHDRLTQLIHRAAEDAVPDSLDLWPRVAADVEARIAPRTQRPPQRRAWPALVAAPTLVVIVLLAGALLLLKGFDDGGGGIHSAALNDSGTPTISPAPSATPLRPSQLTMTMIVHGATVTSAALTGTPIPANVVATVMPTPSPIPPDAFMTPHVITPMDLIASVVPTPIPAESLDPATTDLEAYGTVGRFHLREAPSDDAPAIALLDAGRMTVLSQREVGGELWYQVRAMTAYGPETGWVKATYVQVFPASQEPLFADSDFLPAADIEPLYTTYHSAALDLTFDAPAAWTPYEDPALNRDDLGVAAISFYEALSDVHSLADGAPEAGAMLMIMRIADVDALDLAEPGDASSVHAIVSAVIGEDRLPPAERLLTFYTSNRDNVKTLYLLITPPGESTSAYLERYDHILESAGIWMFETTDIMIRDFVDGIFTHSGVLTHDDPRRIYTMEAGRLTPGLLSGDGWVLAQVDGAYRTPQLSIDHADQSFTTFERYASDEGAVLFRIPGGTDRLDFFHFNLDGYYVQTHGDYTFTLRPVTNAIAIDATPQTISLRQDQPVVLRFDLPDDKAARLQIDTLQALSMDEALTSRVLPQPQVNVLLPHGETLATYYPRRSESLGVTFMPPMQGQQYIVLNPVDLCLPDMTQEECAAYTRSHITLSVNIQPAETTRRLNAPPQPSTGNTLTWLGCRSTLWEGTPPTRSPLGVYDILSQDAAAITLGAEFGTPVQAAGAGTVIYAGWLADGYGSTVVIAHGESYSIYAHLGLVYTHCGDHVDAGDRIASVGKTGDITEPTLRFEVRGADFAPRDVADWIAF